MFIEVLQTIVNKGLTSNKQNFLDVKYCELWTYDILIRVAVEKIKYKIGRYGIGE